MVQNRSRNGGLEQPAESAMATAAEMPCFRALTKGLAALQSSFERIGHGSDDFRLLIPRALGERIEAELMAADPAAWLPFTDGISIYADGHLKQFIICESIIVGWKMGACREPVEDRPAVKRTTPR
jgi:hypothetical protein